MPKQVMKEAFNSNEQRYFRILRVTQGFLVVGLATAGFIGLKST